MGHQMGITASPSGTPMHGDPAMMCPGPMTAPGHTFGAPPLMCGDAVGQHFGGMGPAWIPPGAPQPPQQTPQQQQQQPANQSQFATQPANVIVPGQISAYFENWTADQGPASGGPMGKMPANGGNGQGQF